MGFELGTGFVSSLISARKDQLTHLEDFSDRLSHYFSCGIILMLAGVTMTNVYFLRPISCTLPTNPENKFTEFVESVCWVKGTIALNRIDSMPRNKQEWDNIRQRSDISFYQWVPFCLSVQAMLFFLPHMVWQSLVNHTMGENLEAVLELARGANRLDDVDKRRKAIKMAATQLFRLARQHQDNRSGWWANWQRRAARSPTSAVCAVGKRMGNLVPVAYLFVKVLYLVNALGQLHIIRVFLGHSGGLVAFGDALISTLATKHEWGESEFFPRQTYCPVTVRHLGTNNNVYTAICALPVNMFNEKIYIFLWLWIALVSVITAASLVIWSLRSLWQTFRSSFVRDYLLVTIQGQLNEPLSIRNDEKQHLNGDCQACQVSEEEPQLARFIDESVRSDGAFILRMIRSNAGDVITGEILSHWWHLFYDLQKAESEMVVKCTDRDKTTSPLQMCASLGNGLGRPYVASQKSEFI